MKGPHAHINAVQSERTHGFLRAVVNENGTSIPVIRARQGRKHASGGESVQAQGEAVFSVIPEASSNATGFKSQKNTRCHEI